jgi:Holliday junction resolvase
VVASSVAGAAMSLNRHDAQRDANEKQIVVDLRRAGWSVLVVSGAGVPDLVIGKGGVTRLVEIKSVKGTLTERQEIEFSAWRGSPVIVGRTTEEVIEAFSGSSQIVSRGCR